MLQITDKDFKYIMGVKASKIYRMVENQVELNLDEVNIVLDSTLQQDVNLFYIPKHHRRLIIENVRINIRYNGENTKHKIILFNNNSRELTVKNCIINFSSSTQVSFTAIYNYGSLDTPLDIQADNLLVDSNRIYSTVNARSIEFANSICAFV